MGRGRGTAHAHNRLGRTLTFEVSPAARHTSLCFVCALMASSFAWLSVLIKQNLKTVVKCSWEDTFGMLLGKLEMQAEVTVEKVEICANDKFVDAHIVPIDAPVRLTEQFKCSCVCLSLESDEVSQSSGTRKNAAEVLMASSRQIVLPAPLTPPEGKELRKDQQMYNQGRIQRGGCGGCNPPFCSNFLIKYLT